MKKVLDVKIVSHSKISDDIFKMQLESSEIACEAKPGQFLSIKVGNDESKILRRPISICDVNKNLVTIIYQIKGEGTKILSNLNVGDFVNVIGPLGNGFPISENLNCAILGGGIGVFPLLYLQKTLNTCKVDTFLGFRNSSCIVLRDEFSNTCEQFCVTTDDGSSDNKGYAVDYLSKYIEKYDVVYACGPTPMLKRAKKICEENGVLCYLSLEQRMGCGIGACLVCACKIKVENELGYTYKHVCKDGPIFNSNEVCFDEEVV